MSRRKKLKQQQYNTSAHIHVRKRLAQRYPRIYKSIHIKDLKEAPFIKLFKSSKTRWVIATLVNDVVIYVIKNTKTTMLHTVLTEDQVRTKIEKMGLNILFTDEDLRKGIVSKCEVYEDWYKSTGGDV